MQVGTEPPFNPINCPNKNIFPFYLNFDKIIIMLDQAHWTVLPRTKQIQQFWRMAQHKIPKY